MTRNVVIVTTSAITPNHRGWAESFGLSRISGGAIVTALSPRLRKGCQRTAPQDTSQPDQPKGDRRKGCEKLFTAGIKPYYRRYILHEAHDSVPAIQARNIAPRHRRPAGSPGLRPGALCLSPQSFSLPCAR